MEVMLGGKISYRQKPFLYRFLERTDLRSFHGRSMFCLLIKKAVALTSEETQKYSAIYLSMEVAPKLPKLPRRFRVSLTEQDHPETVRLVNAYGVEKLNTPRFLHLIETAAGLMFADSAASTPQVPHSQPPSLPPTLPPEPLATPEKVKVVKPKAKPITHSMMASGVIESSVSHDNMAVMGADDLESVFG